MARHRGLGSAFRILGYAMRQAERSKRASQRAAQKAFALQANIQQKATRQEGGSVRTDGVAFEIATARLLNALGWNTKLTSSTGDFGADIVAVFGSEKLVVQCKDWTCKVGVSAVQEVTFAKFHYHAQHGIVVAREGFTAAARIAAASANVALFNHSQLRNSNFNRGGNKSSPHSMPNESDLFAAAYRKVEAEIKHKTPSKSQDPNTQDVFSKSVLNSFKRILSWFWPISTFSSKMINDKPDSTTHANSGISQNSEAGRKNRVIRHCFKCHSCLRLETNRGGMVKCPVCGGIEFHQT